MRIILPSSAAPAAAPGAPTVDAPVAGAPLRHGMLLSPSASPASVELPAPQSVSTSAQLQRLGDVARAMAGDPSLRLKSGAGWGWDPASHTMTCPAEMVQKAPAAQQAASVAHAAGRARYARGAGGLGKAEGPLLHLWNSVDGARTTKLLEDQQPGAASILEALDPPDAGPSRCQRLTQEILREAVHGPRASSHPEVRAAMDAARTALDAATRVSPGPLDEAALQRASSDAWEIIQRGIWPIYKKLLEQDRADGLPDPEAPKPGQPGAEQKPSPGACSPDGAGNPQSSKEGAKDGDGAAEGQADGQADGSGAEGSPAAEGQAPNGQDEAKPADASRPAGQAATQPQGQSDANGTSDPQPADTATPQGTNDLRTATGGREGGGPLQELQEHQEAPEASAADMDIAKNTVSYNGDTSKSLEDEIAALEERLRTRPPSANSAAGSAYEAVRRRHSRAIDGMVSDIGNSLLRDNMPELQGHFRSGTFDRRRAIQAEFRREATGHADARVFLRRDTPQVHNTAIVLCMDISASMTGANIAAAREAYVVFREALRELGIAAGVVAYHSQAFVLAPMGIEPVGEPDAAFSQLVPLGGNNEPGALKLAGEMLAATTATSKVVFLITDGGAVADCRSYVEQMEHDTDIKIVGIGIGAGCAEVPAIYNRHVVVPAVEDLPREMGKLLEQVFVPET